jgi:hypothetical protein
MKKRYRVTLTESERGEEGRRKESGTFLMVHGGRRWSSYTTGRPVRPDARTPGSTRETRVRRELRGAVDAGSHSLGDAHDSRIRTRLRYRRNPPTENRADHDRHTDRQHGHQEDVGGFGTRVTGAGRAIAEQEGQRDDSRSTKQAQDAGPKQPTPVFPQMQGYTKCKHPGDQSDR